MQLNSIDHAKILSGRIGPLPWLGRIGGMHLLDSVGVKRAGKTGAVLTTGTGKIGLLTLPLLKNGAWMIGALTLLRFLGWEVVGLVVKVF